MEIEPGLDFGEVATQLGAEMQVRDFALHHWIYMQ